MVVHTFHASSGAGPAGPQPPHLPQSSLVWPLLLEHFGPLNPEDLNVSERTFPFRVRVDLQKAVDHITAAGPGVIKFCGVRQRNNFESLEFSALLIPDSQMPPMVSPPHYEEVDIGEDRPARCLKNGLWLLERDGQRCAMILSPRMEHGRSTGMQIQVATLNSPAGALITDSLFKALEQAVADCHSYRGKILSLESKWNYTGQSTGIKVHKLRTVTRDQVILPAKTLELLDRNILRFVERRKKLAEHGQPTKKGILFYGPPGTGKSHTIHYLAGALKGHTTLLITAEQVCGLDEYMTLARLLQPSVVVLEDVDLIARDRSEMHNPWEEATLNKLLNEMDGLKETADIIFILTTNRPEALEAALTARPGRVDQAIEFPLPDESGRRKLARLYGGDLPLTEEMVSMIVSRTEKTSAAFVKELMRRSVQFFLERDGAASLEARDIDDALDEILFSGGALNLKLLGGAVPSQSPPA